MKPIWILIALVIMFALLAPVPTAQQHGTYNTVSHLAYCDDHNVCLHEIGHALDQQAGWISQSPEFQRALQMYLYVEMRKPKLTAMPAYILELTYRSGEGMDSVKMEIYAYLFQWSAGNPERMPEVMRSFYDWQTAQRLIHLLLPDQKIYWLI